MKKLLVVFLLTACVVFGAFAAGSQESTGATTAVKVSAPGVMPIVEETVSLSVAVYQSAIVEDFDTNLQTKWMEELSNVHINWQPIPSAAIDEKRTLLLASGDLPDVFMATNMTRTEELSNGAAGVFIALNDYIDKQGFYTKQMFAQCPWIKSAMVAPDGNIYGLPGTSGMYHIQRPQKYWIYDPWMKKLGLEYPTTIDEFYDMLVAFKTQDPNGNGLQDEIPMSGAVKGGWYTRIPMFVMNAFIYYDAYRFWLIEDGKVGISPVKEEYRDGLRFMKKLYDEGLIDPAAFVQDKNQLKAIGENPDAVILGSAPGGWFGQIVQNASDSGRYQKYEPLPPLTGPKGVRMTQVQPIGVATGQFVITNVCEYPEVAFKWGDFQLSEEAYLHNAAGVEGVHWEWVTEPNVKSIGPDPAKWRNLAVYSVIQNANWGGIAPFWGTNMSETVEASGDMYEAANLSWRLNEATKLYDIDGLPETYPANMDFDEDESAEIAMLWASLEAYIWESSDRFITGDLDLDADWNAYLKEFDKIGLPRYLQIHQQALDKKKALAN